jgi:hypothetical protein
VKKRKRKVSLKSKKKAIIEIEIMKRGKDI